MLIARNQPKSAARIHMLHLLLRGAFVMAFTVSLAAATDITKPTALLPAKDLSAFYVFTKDHGLNNDPKNVFTLTKGMLRISGEEQGYLATKSEYSNYHLIAEYKWGTLSPDKKDRDSGIFIHSIGPDKYPMTSIECNILNGSQNISGEVLLMTPEARLTINGEVRKSGSHHPTIHKTNPEKPLGEWNTFEVFCVDGKVQVRVNGHVIVEGWDAVPRKGKIFLQSNRGEIFFRRLDLLPIDKSAVDLPERRSTLESKIPESAFTQLFNGRDFSGWKVDTNYWSVKDGLLDFFLDGSKGEAKFSRIICTNAEAKDFEVRLRCRFLGRIEKERGLLQLGLGDGYFTEIHANPSTYGAIFLSGAGYPMLAQPSQRRTIRAGEPRNAAPIKERVNPVPTVVNSFKQEDWNDVVLMANGAHVTVTVNGILTAELFDEDRKSRGVGPVVRLAGRRDNARFLHAQFRDIRFRPLTSADSSQ